MPLQILIFLSHIVHGWTQRGSARCWIPPNVTTKPLPPITFTAALLRSQKPCGELLLEQTVNETVTVPWRSETTRTLLLLSCSSIYPVVLQFTHDHNLCEYTSVTGFCTIHTYNVCRHEDTWNSLCLVLPKGSGPGWSLCWASFSCSPFRTATASAVTTCTILAETSSVAAAKLEKKKRKVCYWEQCFKIKKISLNHKKRRLT